MNQIVLDRFQAIHAQAQQISALAVSCVTDLIEKIKEAVGPGLLINSESVDSAKIDVRRLLVKEDSEAFDLAMDFSNFLKTSPGTVVVHVKVKFIREGVFFCIPQEEDSERLRPSSVENDKNISKFVERVLAIASSAADKQVASIALGLIDQQ